MRQAQRTANWIAISNGVNIFDSAIAVPLPISVISTEHEGAKRLSASGEIPRMRARWGDSGSFNPDSVTEVRRQSGRSMGRTPRIGMAEDAPSGFLDYALSLPLCGILRPPLEMTAFR